MPGRDAATQQHRLAPTAPPPARAMTPRGNAAAPSSSPWRRLRRHGCDTERDWRACTMLSHSRMLAKNWFPRPSPLLAPFTSPAMSCEASAAARGTAVSGGERRWRQQRSSSSGRTDTVAASTTAAPRARAAPSKPCDSSSPSLQPLPAVLPAGRSTSHPFPAAPKMPPMQPPLLPAALTTNSTLVGMIFSLPEMLLRQGKQGKCRDPAEATQAAVPRRCDSGSGSGRSGSGGSGSGGSSGACSHAPMPAHTPPPRRLAAPAAGRGRRAWQLGVAAASCRAPEDLQAGVWHRHNAHVWLDGAEREVGCLCLCILTQRIEHGGLRQGGGRGGPRGRQGARIGQLGAGRGAAGAPEGEPAAAAGAGRRAAAEGLSTHLADVGQAHDARLQAHGDGGGPEAAGARLLQRLEARPAAGQQQRLIGGGGGGSGRAASSKACGSPYQLLDIPKIPSDLAKPAGGASLELAHLGQPGGPQGRALPTQEAAGA